MNNDKVLVILEPVNHPNSILPNIKSRVETLSIINVHSSRRVEEINSPPIYNDKYLLIFDDLKVFTSSIPYVKLNIMFPVMQCNTTFEVNEVVDTCNKSKVPYSVYENKYTREDAYNHINLISGKEVSKSFCDSLIRATGLNPTRIISGIAALEGKDYTVHNISKYVDKYSYVSNHDILLLLLNKSKSNKNRKATIKYLIRNRHWYSHYIKPNLINIVDECISTFLAISNGELSKATSLDYIAEHKITKYDFIFYSDLFEKITIVELYSLKEFISKSTPLTISLLIQKG